MLIEVPKGDASRHEPACRECGEPWPCRTRREEYRFRAHLQNVRCEFCGKARVSWGSLTIDEGLDGRAIYFHARKLCTAAAKVWWETNVKPLLETGRVDFLEGQTITSLVRYVAVRSKIKEASE